MGGVLTNRSLNLKEAGAACFTSPVRLRFTYWPSEVGEHNRRKGGRSVFPYVIKIDFHDFLTNGRFFAESLKSI